MIQNVKETLVNTGFYLSTFLGITSQVETVRNTIPFGDHLSGLGLSPLVAAGITIISKSEINQKAKNILVTAVIGMGVITNLLSEFNGMNIKDFAKSGITSNFALHETWPDLEMGLVGILIGTIYAINKSSRSKTQYK